MAAENDLGARGMGSVTTGDARVLGWGHQLCPKDRARFPHAPGPVSRGLGPRSTRPPGGASLRRGAGSHVRAHSQSAPGESQLEPGARPARGDQPPSGPCGKGARQSRRPCPPDSAPRDRLRRPSARVCPRGGHPDNSSRAPRLPGGAGPRRWPRPCPGKQGPAPQAEGTLREGEGAAWPPGQACPTRAGAARTAPGEGQAGVPGERGRMTDANQLRPRPQRRRDTPDPFYGGGALPRAMRAAQGGGG